MEMSSHGYPLLAADGSIHCSDAQCCRPLDDPPRRAAIVARRRQLRKVRGPERAAKPARARRAVLQAHCFKRQREQCRFPRRHYHLPRLARPERADR
eukprot:5101012-Pleurochrysis_carterae.AAC.1